MQFTLIWKDDWITERQPSVFLWSVHRSGFTEMMGHLSTFCDGLHSLYFGLSQSWLGSSESYIYCFIYPVALFTSTELFANMLACRALNSQFRQQGTVVSPLLVEIVSDCLLVILELLSSVFCDFVGQHFCIKKNYFNLM